MGFYFSRNCLCLFVIIFNVEGMVINWRCFVSLCSTRCCYSLYNRSSFRFRSIYFRRISSRNNAIPFRTFWFKSGRNYWFSFYCFFWIRFIYYIDKSYVCFNSNNHNGQYISNYF